MTRANKRSGRAPRRRRGDPQWDAQSSVKGFGLLLFLVACVVVSGLQVVITTHELRKTHGRLQEARNQQDLLLTEHSRLLLERGALVAYQNIERIAVAELGMRFPDRVERIVP